MLNIWMKRLTLSLSDKGVCRITPAALGLLKRANDSIRLIQHDFRFYQNSIKKLFSIRTDKKSYFFLSVLAFSSDHFAAACPQRNYVGRGNYPGYIVRL